MTVTDIAAQAATINNTDRRHLAADKKQVSLFVETIFKNCRSGGAPMGGRIAMRAFRQHGGKPVLLEWEPLGDKPVSRAAELATRVAQRPGEDSAAFCPPVCLFNETGRASEADVAACPVIVADLDEQPDEGRRLLESILGPPILVVASGGVWTDPEGHRRDKVHLYWRLTNPAVTADDRRALRAVRKSVAILAGGDESAVALCHPMRWPGSWHTKDEPRLCRIVGGDRDREIDLASAAAAMAEHGGATKPARAPSGLPGAASLPKTIQDIVFREVWRRRAEWVQDVILINAGAACAEWVISSEDLDRDLQERLVINPSWCHDFGTERSHTPISLICEFGRVTQDGEIEFGGCPTYGAVDGQPYVAIGEPDERVRRPTEAEAFRWLIERLGSDDATVPDALDVGTLGRALGLAEEAMTSELARTVFDEFDEAGDVVELVRPSDWTAKQIAANRSRLPILRAIDPAAFAGHVEAWDTSGQALPGEVEATIAEEMGRVRRRQERNAPPGTNPTGSADAARGGRITLLSLADVLAQGLDDGPAPLVDGLLDQGALSVLYGDSNVGKTFVTMDLAFSVATGRTWAGQRTTQKPVVYIATEGGRGSHWRLRALVNETGIRDAPFYIYTSGVDLLRADADLEPLIEAVKGVPGAGLVVIDTLSRALAGGDENSSVDMGKLVRNLDKLKERTEAHVMVVHHSGKKAANGARGHSLLRAATDTEIEVAEGRITATKQRDMPVDFERAFILRPQTIGLVTCP